MDIDLLAKMVKNLILDNDMVVLPGLGCFVAEVVPSTFSDKGYTINPPYRRLYFRSKPDEGDELISFYAEANNVPVALAENVIRDFLTDMKEVLFIKKTVVFPGLGRLRATKENDIFFVADEDLDIYPAGFGLEPVSLKTHRETQEEVSEAVAGLKSILDDPMPEPVESPMPMDEPAPEPVVLQEPEPQPEPVLPSTPESTPETAPETTLESAPETTPETVQEPASPASVPAPEAPAPEPLPAPAPRFVPYSQRAAAQKPESNVQKWFKQACASTKSAFRNAWSWLMDPKRKVAVLVIVSVLAALILFVVGFLALSNLFPEWMDSLLYSPEELEILNYRYE